MRLGIRRSFDRFKQFERRYKLVKTPMELALPYRINDYFKMRHRLNDIADMVNRFGLNVLSVHAPQGPITHPDFLDWGNEVGKFADSIGAKDITIHPNNYKGRNRITAQDDVLRRISRLQKEYDTTFAIETFSGSRRILRLAEIMEYELPMVLDVAHIHKDDEIMNIIEGYHPNIVTVHLSARDTTQHHLPIDNFCRQVVQKLKAVGWYGNVILEYLPWYHGRLEQDLESLRCLIA